MEEPKGFFTGNLVLDLALVSWFIAQFIKLVIHLILHKEIDMTKMWSSGGMPSSHSSFVCSSVASIGMIHGFKSSLFALSSIFSFVVMYDACNVRRAAGEQAKIINILKKQWEGLSPKLMETELKELLGHTPLQVLAGCALGLVTGVVGVWHSRSRKDV